MSTNAGVVAPRPPLLIVIAVLALIQGVLGLVVLTTIVRGGLRMMGSSLGQGAVMGTVLVIAAVPFFLGPVLHLLFGWGALRRASWARAVGITSSLIGLIGAFAMRAEGPRGAWVVWIVLSVVTLVYLLTAPGRQALRH